MDAFALPQLIDACSKAGDPYLEFIRHPSMSVGLYMLAAGAEDLQQPHTEDEVYYVISGSAFMLVDNESRPVSAGSIIFVKANIVHRFHTITEDLTVLVFFAPAEYINKQAS